MQKCDSLIKICVITYGNDPKSYIFIYDNFTKLASVNLILMF